MLKLKLQYFGHLMWRADSLEKILVLGKIEGRRRRGDWGDGWMASLTQWMWIWANFRKWWRTGRPGMLHSMGLQRVGHDWMTELNWTDLTNQSILKEISPGCSLEGMMLSWNSSTLATSREELTHWKRLWCWEGLGAGGEGDDRGWDGWMASPTRWTWVWVNYGRWWWTGRPGVLHSMGLQRFGHDWLTEPNWMTWPMCLFFCWYNTILTMVILNIKYFNYFIYLHLFLGMLAPHCCAWVFCSVASRDNL